MFNKLLSNLPFNPGLIQQVVFYGKRLHRETAIRKVGFAFIAMTMILQIFAVMKPAQASVSCDPSGNDIIHCGFNSKQEAINHCKANSQGISTILKYYGISCDTVASSTETTIRSTDYGRKLISMGRKPFKKPGEFNVNISGVGNLFWRPLWSWDSAGPSTYRVLSMRTNDNQPIMLMFECGNLVMLNDYKPPTPQQPSQLSIVKVNEPKSDVKPGDTITYTLVYANKGGPAYFFSVNDILPPNVTLVSAQPNLHESTPTTLKWTNNNPPYYVFGNTDALGTPGFAKVTVRVNDRVPSGTTICNRAYLQDVIVENGAARPRNTSEVQACNTVRIICPEGTILNGNGVDCDTVQVPDAACSSLAVIGDKGKKRTLQTKTSLVNGATVSSYTYVINNGSKTDTKTVSSTQASNSLDYEFSEAKTYDVKVTVKTSVGDKTGTPCQAKVTIADEGKPMIGIEKRASNITSGIKDANNTTAKAGDVIEYTLVTKNFGNAAATNVSLQPEDITDVLEYATLDLNNLGGAVFDPNTKVLSWNQKANIDAGASIEKKFKVKVKDPIPSTPRPEIQNNRASYDLVMTNIYGNTINIKLPTTLIKTTETTTTTLPNTGPGESIAMAFVLTSIVGYFFARTRLKAKELDIVRLDYANGNGEI